MATARWQVGRTNSASTSQQNSARSGDWLTRPTPIRKHCHSHPGPPRIRFRTTSSRRGRPCGPHLPPEALPTPPSQRPTEPRVPCPLHGGPSRTCQQHHTVPPQFLPHHSCTSWRRYGPPHRRLQQIDMARRNLAADVGRCGELREGVEDVECRAL